MTGTSAGASALAPTPNTFNFESHTVRVVMRDDEPWFVATDVCVALGLSNPSEAMRSLDSDERMTLSLTEGHSGRRGGARLQTIISESGMYTLVLRCRDAVKPGTVPHRFRKWVTSIVLPAIRKTGQFTAQPCIDDAPAAARTPADLASLYPADVERALQLLNKHIYQADRYTGMLIVLQDDEAKEPVVISAGSYRHKRARALTDFARASVQISDLIEAGV
ncbi:Bro-N domain-containing protein [Ralstonia sp. CHL-2022]|uniref:BRO-N domain-containing protein n=1 Tax=Ralstonia mojiangensis TaxID=2953895 RepID=UPI0021B3FEF3|nr:Bro-N domain-containing protein [Ralstonia mojiangensis]MCT7295571.1 Bro-N domain-containing protein [Ralstonia mojiangensis]